MKIRVLLVLFAILVWPTTLWAQSNEPSYTDFFQASPDVIESSDLIEALAPPRGYAFKKMAVNSQIFFGTNSSELTPSSHRFVIEKLALALSSPELDSYAFSIEGHTDDRGSISHDEDLSRRRAEAVRVLLASHGVPVTRLKALGRGEGSPRQTNSTSTGRSQNRRVEVMNLGK